MQRGTAELTVRGVERSSIVGNPVNPVTPVFGQEEDLPAVPAGAGIVAVSPGTVYTLNATNIKLQDLHGKESRMQVGLLFDDIMNEVNDRQSLLESQANARMPALAPGASRYFQSQYLDLVDMNNGNAWVTASEPVEVYWGYPDGTDAATQFTLWHFRGLHRDGTDDPEESGYDLEDILAVEPEQVPIENTEAGIRFRVEPGGFSPFVLVWEDATGSVQPDRPAASHTPSPGEEEDGPTSPISLPFTGGDGAVGRWLLVFAVSLGATIGISVYRKRTPR